MQGVGIQRGCKAHGGYENERSGEEDVTHGGKVLTELDYVGEALHHFLHDTFNSGQERLFTFEGVGFAKVKVFENRNVFDLFGDGAVNRVGVRSLNFVGNA